MDTFINILLVKVVLWSHFLARSGHKLTTLPVNYLREARALK
jgi:hypothetical protein